MAPTRSSRARPVEDFQELPEFDDEEESEAEAEASEPESDGSEGSGEELEDQPPTSIDPYAVLEVSKEASEDDIRRAYRKLALKHHPDKVAEDKKDEAKEDFQRLAFAYAILSDPTRRNRYDVTGSTTESVLDADDDDFDWLSFYRNQYENVITEEKIQEFTDQYKQSDEERKDLLASYTKYKGKMDGVYETVLLSNVLDDDERFRGIIDEAIKSGEVERYEKYTNESEQSKQNRIRKAQKELKDAEREQNKMKNKSSKKAAKTDDMGDLAAMIQKNQQNRAGFMDQLEAKYGGGAGGSGGKKKRKMEEPPEELFAANRAKGKKGKP